MSTCILCLGSNTPDCIAKLQYALNRLADFITITAYTKAYGCPSYNGLGASYSNVVVEGTTSLAINQLIVRSKIIEQEAGRTPGSKVCGIMPLDIDLVIYDNVIVSIEDYNRAHFRLGLKYLSKDISSFILNAKSEF